MRKPAGVNLLNTIIKKLRTVLPAALRKLPFHNKNTDSNISRPPVYIPLMNVEQERMLGCEVHTEEPSNLLAGNKPPIMAADNKDVFRQVTESFSPHQHMLAEGFIFVFSIVLTDWNSERLLEECQRFLNIFASRKIVLILEVSVAEFDEKSPPDKVLFEQLHRAGVRIVIKNFGTGIASLSLLLQIPVDGLKIEPEFMVNDPVSRHIVDNLADLAARLEIPLFADGISSHRQLKQLESFNVAYISGSLCGKTMPANILFPARLVDECQAAVKTEHCTNQHICTYKSYCERGEN